METYNKFQDYEDVDVLSLKRVTLFCRTFTLFHVKHFYNFVYKRRFIDQIVAKLNKILYNNPIFMPNYGNRA